MTKPESPGPRQTPRLLPTTSVSSPAYSMSVIVIILTALAAAVFLTISILACRRQRKQWRNRKRWDKDKISSSSYICVRLLVPHFLVLSTERWRPQRWALFHQSCCWIDSTPTPCTSGFPCCWTPSCWPSSIPEIISNMLEILEREPLDGFSKQGERRRWSIGWKGRKGEIIYITLPYVYPFEY